MIPERLPSGPRLTGSALIGVLGGPGSLGQLLEQTPAYQARFSPFQLPEGFVTQIVLAMTAILCLPRQFHVAIVEYPCPLALFAMTYIALG